MMSYFPSFLSLLAILSSPHFLSSFIPQFPFPHVVSVSNWGFRLRLIVCQSVELSTRGRQVAVLVEKKFT
jgi:hypothetical protein